MCTRRVQLFKALSVKDSLSLPAHIKSSLPIFYAENIAVVIRTIQNFSGSNTFENTLETRVVQANKC